jgi:hypothetical protein
MMKAFLKVGAPVAAMVAIAALGAMTEIRQSRARFAGRMSPAT